MSGEVVPVEFDVWCAFIDLPYSSTISTVPGKLERFSMLICLMIISKFDGFVTLIQRAMKLNPRVQTLWHQ